MLDAQHVTVLVNPAAASGNGHVEWLRLQPHFEEVLAGADVQVIETASPKQAAQLAASLNTQLLISFSGDGAAHTLAQGLMSRPADGRPLLAVVPIGSGNDFARALGVPMNPWLAISRLPRGQRSLIDVGTVNGRCFLNTFSLGADAVIADRTTELRRSTRRRGFMLYAQAAVGSIVHGLKAHRFRIMLDDQYVERELLSCAIQNGPYYGGGFKVAPHALLDDGRLDVCLTADAPTLTALYYLARIANGTHEGLRAIEACTASRLSLDVSEPVTAQVDGEKFEGALTAEGTWHYDVELLPQALAVVSMR